MLARWLCAAAAPSTSRPGTARYKASTTASACWWRAAMAIAISKERSGHVLPPPEGRRASMPGFLMNTAGLQSGQSDRELSQALAGISLRCVECAALYPGAADLTGQPRYRCECGGVLDVETVYRHPAQETLPLQEAYDALAAPESDLMPLA